MGGKGNDQVRFEGYVVTLNSSLKIIAPVREWGMGRDEELKYAKEHNIPVLQTSKSPYSYDENMWSNTAEGGEIENPELTAPLERILRWCKTPQAAPDKVDTVKLDFEKGVPVAMDGKKLELWDLIMQLNKRAGKAGCGFHQIVEDRIVGLKVRGVYENPAASVGGGGLPPGNAVVARDRGRIVGRSERLAPSESQQLDNQFGFVHRIRSPEASTVLQTVRHPLVYCHEVCCHE